MKKIYSIVLMAAMLFVGTNAWAATHEVANANALENAWKNAASGDVIQLTASFTFDKILWLGTTNMSDAAKSLTLDLNGQSLAQASGMKYFILITHGDLNIISSLPGGAILGNTSGNEEVIRLTGSTYRTLDPKTAESGYFTHLTIGTNVEIHSQKQNAVVVDIIDNTTVKNASNKDVWVFAYATGVGANSTGAVPSALPYSTKVYNASYGVANGVRVDVYGTIHGKKYAMKTNGNLGSPSTAGLYDAATLAGKQFVANPNPLTYYTSIEATDVNYSPFTRIYGTARLETDVVYDGEYGNKEKKPVALYASGYARWLIEGTCEGATAVYVKSGQLDIHDATISSNYAGTFISSTTQQSGSGVVGVGSAIVMQSSDAYAGDIDVTVSGDTKVEASNGYAVEEAVISKADTTKVDAITITGGTFEGGKVGSDPESGDPIYGTLIISEETKEAKDDAAKDVTVVVGAGNINGNVQVGDNNTTGLSEIVDSSASHTTIVTDENGKQTVVISAGAEIPAAEKDKESVHDQTGNVNWKHNDESVAAMVDTIKTDDVTLDELEINQAYDQTLVINAGRKLTAKHIVLGGKAQIIVEAGAKLIVTGDQGIATASNKNIILRTQEGNPSMFLIKPVANGTNKHPRATVEFISKSITDGSVYTKQRFGIPMNGKLDAMTTKYNDADVQTAMSKFDYANNLWYDFGWINVAGKDENLDQMADPFAYYQMQHNVKYQGTVVTMTGELVGNENPMLNILGNYWNGFANSYMAPISGEELFDMIPETVDRAFYLYDVEADYAKWMSVTRLNLEDAEIQPMQPFLIRNTKAAADATIDYGDAVYYPITGENKPAGAPARRSALSDITKVKITVNGEGNKDRVIVAEDAQFSAEFDNGYDAAKYMNDGINLYVTADEKMAAFATDNLENTYVGFQTVNGGTYTIEFANVQGEELTLVDLETGARVAMVEGNAYEFTAAANSVNDYRFEIVESAKLPTAIDNTEAVKSAKGIYTITGQYLGEMNVWNTLPAGVYVINGEKRVK